MLPFLKDHFLLRGMKSNIASFAVTFHKSDGKFTRIFKKTDFTLDEYITNIRVAKARELLKTLTYQKITNAVGLESEKHLGRILSK